MCESYTAPVGSLIQILHGGQLPAVEAHQLSVPLLKISAEGTCVYHPREHMESWQSYGEQHRKQLSLTQDTCKIKMYCTVIFNQF